MIIPIILLNYNSSPDCSKCISFLQKQQGVEIEIVVVDNCSPREGEQDAIRKLCDEQGCTFIPATENRGYNAGNNIGLRYAAEKGYKYALIANPDMEFPQENYVVSMVGKMEEDEKIAVLSSDVLTPENKHQNPQREATYMEELLWPITILRYRYGDWYLQDYTRSGYCEKLSGCCLLLRIDFIQKIGFFDEKVFLYSEESILSKQVKQYAYKMYYLAEAVAIHRHIKSTKGNPGKNLAFLFNSRKYFTRNYRGVKGLKLYMLLASLSIQQFLYKNICFRP